MKSGDSTAFKLRVRGYTSIPSILGVTWIGMLVNDFVDRFTLPAS